MEDIVNYSCGLKGAGRHEAYESIGKIRQVSKLESQVSLWYRVFQWFYAYVHITMGWTLLQVEIFNRSFTAFGLDSGKPLGR